MTPLLVAASRQCWDTVNVLFCAGTDFTAKDLESSNFLHLAIRTGGDLKLVPTTQNYSLTVHTYTLVQGFNFI